jgi:glycosyltransferase involved in cell wall biosynthesis
VSADLVSIGLPVRNASAQVEKVIQSVLAQDYERLELVISDNASTDSTEDVCRDLAGSDPRIVYVRQPENIGLLNNFMATIDIARGTYFRWIGDDDRLEPGYATRCVRAFTDDPRLILVTCQVAYAGPTGDVQTAAYEGHGLGSSDPVERLIEMLRLLNESYLMIDPLYGMVRRSEVAPISRRNMLREDEVFATKLALAGPWAHIPEVLALRHWKHERIGQVARRLDVPTWQSHFSHTLAFREMMRWLRQSDLDSQQRHRARSAVRGWYVRRQQRIAARRWRKLVRVTLRRG